MALGDLTAPSAGLRRPGVRVLRPNAATQLLRQMTASADIDGAPGGDAVAAEGPEVVSAAAPAPPPPLIEEAGGGSARRSAGRRRAD